MIPECKKRIYIIPIKEDGIVFFLAENIQLLVSANNGVRSAIPGDINFVSVALN